MEIQDVNIATIEDLINALKDPNYEVRVATLQAIARHPEKAASLAEKAHVDLFQELIDLSEQSAEAGLRIGYVHALLSLDDDRVPGIAKKEFLATDNTDMALLIASKIALFPAAERIDFLAPVVMAATNQSKSRAAANLLADCQNLPVDLALRVAIVSDHRVVIAPLSDHNLPAWLAELQGPYPRKTRKILLEKQDGSFLALLDQWEKLPGPIKLWSFNEAMKQDPNAHASLVCTVLQQEESSELLCVALAASQSLLQSVTVDELIAAFVSHPDPLIRTVAIDNCRSSLDWASMLQHETTDLVRVSIIKKMGRSQQIASLELLGGMLENSNWRIRAAMTHVMVALVPDSIPLLQQLFLHHKPVVKAAAMQALQKTGQEAWLEAQLSAI